MMSGSWGSGQVSGPQVEWRWTMPSRIHQLSRLHTLDLLGTYLRLQERNFTGALSDAAGLWDRDRLITAIRNLEDPR
jgi:hypothetical protein